MRKIFTNLTRGLTALAIAGSLVSCPPEKPKAEAEPKQTDYFAEVPMYSESGVALTSGDFDNDGDLDFIISVYDWHKDKANLYFYENDGKGNFTLKPKVGEAK